MARYKKHEAGDDGWSDWDTPIMDGYKLACCDCGLVHRVDFRAIRIVRQSHNGTFVFHELNKRRFRVKFRVSRDNRATGQIRRHKK